MRFLLDTCVCGEAKAQLTRAGHDVVWTADFPADPGDEEILRLACTDDRVLVTLDRDFGELAVVRQIEHKGIIRIVGLPTAVHGAAVLEAVARYGTPLSQGAILTIEPGRVRVRPREER